MFWRILLEKYSARKKPRMSREALNPRKLLEHGMDAPTLLSDDKVVNTNRAISSKPRSPRPRSRRISVDASKRKSFDSGFEQLRNREVWDQFKAQIVRYGVTSASIPQTQFICSGKWREITDSLQFMFERLGLFPRGKDSLFLEAADHE